MQPKSINPYRKGGEIVKTALDFIIANLPVDPTFDNLNDILGGAVFTPDPANPNISNAASLFLGAVLPFAYNGYLNCGLGKYVKYTDNQMVIIHKLLNGIKSVPPETIGDVVDSIDEEIAASSLTCGEQGPLFLATAAARTQQEYWVAQINNPASVWATYLDPDRIINYLHLAGWIEASVQGALLTYGIVKPPEIQLLDLLSASVGSIGLTAGKVVFGWVAVCPPLGGGVTK